MIAEPARLLLQSGTLALWSVLRNRRRVALAVCSVTFGITALILAGGFIEWIFWATREGTIQGGLGHVHVARKGFQDHGTADLDRFLLPAESPILQKLRDRPGVRVVAPRRSFSGLVSHGDITLSFIAEGIDPEAERNFGDVSIIVDGNDLTSRSERAIIMGQGLAANLGVSVGETVVLLVNRANGGVGAVEAHVNGLFATVSKAYDDSAIRIPLTLATELLRTPGSHEWVVVLTDTEHTAQATEALRAEFADSGLEFVPWYDLADFYNKTVTLLSRQMGVIQTIIALIIVLTIGNSMMMGVIERTSEIGTTMALGAPRKGILMQFVLEGVLLGAVGGALGTLLGVLLASIISAIGIPMPPPPGQIRGYRAEMIVTVPYVMAALGIAVGAALAAAAYPAWRASRTIIIEALRHNR